MSTSRMTQTLATSLPKYCGRAGAILSGGAGWVLTNTGQAYDHNWGSAHEYTTTEQLTAGAKSLLFFAPVGYLGGFLAGKGMVKIGQLAAKTGVIESLTGFIKKL